MPRSQQSPTGRIVNFFRTADLAVAQLVLDLCKDEVSARKHKSEAARARANTPPPAVVDETPRGKRKKATRAKGKGTKLRARKAVASAAPATPAVAHEVEPPLPLAEAGDAPN